MRRCSTSLATKEIQVKTTTSYHHIPIRMAIIKGNKKKEIPSGDEDVEQEELAHVAGGKAKRQSHFGKQLGK